jgi:hypothetical protein
MRVTRLQRATQRSSAAKQVPLPHVLVQGSRTQSIGKRSIAAAAGHLPGRPITSTPGGGVNMNKSGINLILRWELLKVSCVT